MRERRTSGVWPIASRMESLISVWLAVTDMHIG